MVIRGIHRQFYATICANITSFVFGIAVGWPSSTLPKLQGSDSPIGPLSQDEATWVSSLMCIGGALSTVIFGWCSEQFGRKISILFITFPTIISWIFILVGTNVYYLYAARFLAGFGGGGAFICVPIFVTEISDDRIRGLLGSLLVLIHNCGIVVGFVICSYLDYFTVPYVGILVSFFFFFGFLPVRESPKYLQLKYEQKDAQRAHEFYHDRVADVKTVSVDYIEAAQAVDNNETKNLTLADLTTPAARKSIILGFILITLCCSCGAFVLLNYTENIFEEAGSSLTPEVSSIIVACIQLFGSYVATFLVERVGRKILIVGSAWGSALCLSTMGFYSLFNHLEYNMDTFRWVPLVCLSLLVFIVANGSGSLPYVVLSEICSQKIRSFVTTICMLEDWILAGIYVKFLPFMMSSWGMFGTMWFFAAVNLIFSVLLIVLLPETKGKSIDAITEMLTRRK